MPKQDDIQGSAPQLPISRDSKAWKAYWESQSQPWRTQPEIGKERQDYLNERRTIRPDVDQGSYPFKDIKLTRADIEWLLARHEKGRGPVDWSDASQRTREGLDLRGADLRQEDLHDLPLARLIGGVPLDEWFHTKEEQCFMAALLLEEANLRGTHLEGAYLCDAHLEKAHFNSAYLREAILVRANLQGAFLAGAGLERANLYEAYLEKSDLRSVRLSDEKHIGPQLADIHWGDTNLAVVKWSQMVVLGDEYEARQKRRGGQVKDRLTRLQEYEQAVRANRQLATVLYSQGLNEDAAGFSYRAQKLQRVALRLQRKFISYFFYGFLDLIAGHGYRPRRTFLWYLFMILVFTIAYHLLGHLPILPDSLVFSLTSFHGRGFFPGLGNEISLHNPLVVLAAFEAVIGLFIEISFIATFTQRFFSR